jgi:hypothetical protein
MITVNHNHNTNHTERENILEKRIETLQERIHQLESEISLKSSSRQLEEPDKTNKNKLPFLRLPVTYTPEQEQSPKLEIVTYSSMNKTNTPLLFVKQLNARVYETIV